MVFGFALFAIGYALFYWGLHHMPGFKRYSLWTLFGLDAFYTALHPGQHLNIPPGQPVQFSTATQGVTAPSQTQPQSPSNSTTPTPLKGGGVSPVGPGLKLGRTDQGVDWSGKGPLYAIGSGTIINVYNTGWPGGTFIVLKLDNPPVGIPSPDIYYAEDITPNVSVGQHVNEGDVIGTATGGPSGIELGFADPTAIGRALAAGQFTGNNATLLGQQFKQWISGLGLLAP